MCIIGSEVGEKMTTHNLADLIIEFGSISQKVDICPMCRAATTHRVERKTYKEQYGIDISVICITIECTNCGCKYIHFEDNIQ